MTPADRSALREQVEAEALKYHKATDGTGEGEYGCPGVKCPGVQRLADFWWPALERIAASLPSGEMALRTVLRLLAENRYDKLPRLDNIVDEDDAYGLDFGHANWSLSLSVYDCGDVGWSLLANDTASYGRAPISEWETNVHPVLQQFLLAASLPPETPSGGQEPRGEQTAAQLLTDLRTEYPAATKANCDACANCGPLVMCAEHSFISALHRQTWTTGQIERAAPPPADAGAQKRPTDAEIHEQRHLQLLGQVGMLLIGRCVELPAAQVVLELQQELTTLRADAGARAVLVERLRKLAGAMDRESNHPECSRERELYTDGKASGLRYACDELERLNTLASPATPAKEQP